MLEDKARKQYQKKINSDTQIWPLIHTTSIYFHHRLHLFLHLVLSLMWLAEFECSESLFALPTILSLWHFHLNILTSSPLTFYFIFFSPTTFSLHYFSIQILNSFCNIQLQYLFSWAIFDYQSFMLHFLLLVMLIETFWKHQYSHAFLQAKYVGAFNYFN